MAGCRDRDGNGHSPAIPALRAQVDCARTTPPVDGALRIHCMVDRGLIHVEGEGEGLILIVDDGNNLLEETVGLVAHFLGGALHGVRGHAMDEGVFAIKQEMAAFWAERVLLAKTGLKSEALRMRHRRKTSIPFPCHSLTKDTSSSVKVSTHPTGPSCIDIFSGLDASSIEA
jgi:hypothetical protein